MSNQAPPPGKIGWIDLTVKDATAVRDFYKQVTGWNSSPVSMGDYDDYNMLPPDDDQPVAGICHAKGPNAEIPPQWMIYIIVENLDKSVEACTRLGGSIINGPRTMDGAKFCIIKDPAGAVAGLYQPA